MKFPNFYFKRRKRPLYLKGKLSSGEKLPVEYERLSYIESTGTQVIDTQVPPPTNEQFKASFDIQFNEVGTRQLMGYAEKGPGYFGVNEKCEFELGAGFVIPNSNGAERSIIIHTFVDLIETCKASITHNGVTLIRESGTSVEFDSMYSIFNILSAANIESYKCHMKLYGAKFYMGDKIIRKFVPCYRKSDNVAGLYDVVNNVFYTNSGTGEFVKGYIQEV